MIEKVLAGLVLLACVLLAVRLLLPGSRRWRFDAAFGRAWRRARERSRPSGRRPVERRREPRAERAAAREAEERARHEAEAAIRRARQGSWKGNVFRPDSFDGEANGANRANDTNGADDAKRPGRDRRNLH